MKMKIKSIHNHGKAGEEYVLLEVTEDCQVGAHILADTTFTDTGRVSNKLRHTFWFPDKAINAGELVVVRTGKGTDDSYKNNIGTKVHRFYWNLALPVWNDQKDAAILVEIKDWSMSKTR